ncbi:MAG: glycoside hydrolase/phage tail family protein [Pseudomonadota bacterium]
MATVVLQTVGAAIGGAVGGPVGAIVGRAAGGLAGNALDQRLFSKDRVVQGPRLEQTRILTSTEGTSVPRVYGRNRLSGQIIWATRFEEFVSREKSSGKGSAGNSTSTTTFSYFANFAIGICEGPISGVRRIWADAQELDLTSIEFRFYKGGEDQTVDPLIEAKQGADNSPAYRGTAYIVFEDFPLSKYGNRIPQFSFEVIRSIGKLEKSIRSISVIPGATEYGYETDLVGSGGMGETYNAHNRHTSIASTDWEASIDELQEVCPNLESVSLVVTWYGTDLRAGECDVLPGVTHIFDVPWLVKGLKRHEVRLVSQIEGRAAFGGTPTDLSILHAIQDLKNRGLKVTINPFLMMDIPEGNLLPWLDQSVGQPEYPWRGEITCFPPPGANGSADKTIGAREQVTSFAQKYSVMVRHYAGLCSQAGGVDGFLIGSELRGLTRVRDENGFFPFVESLVDLASEAKSIMGTECLVTYGADWSEYFGYQPNDGSSDVLYNLDPLWSSASIDAVGIDNYMPTSDWRNGGDPGFPNVHSVHDCEYQKHNIASSEGYDWYYASPGDREERIRTPITDGQGEPWIYRYKDLVSWWSNAHHERLQGVRQSTSTSWLPSSKPIIFTELGCPAIDLGSNQPNVFFDSKSAQSAIPYFSSGERDDLVQRRYLEAHYEYWSEPENNPASDVYEGRMIDPAQITPWAWDARPFPWFPLSLDTWSDGENWHVGHWLTGRLGSCPLDDLINEILSDYGHVEPVVSANGIVDGYIVPEVISARQALEPLLGLFDIKAFEVEGRLAFQTSPYATRQMIESSQIVQEDDQPAVTGRRRSEIELPAEAVVFHTSVFSEFEDRATKSRRIEGGSDRQIALQAPVVMPEGAALAIADNRLQNDWLGREEKLVGLPRRFMDVAAGDVISFSETPERKWQVESVEIGERQNLSLVSFEPVPERMFVGGTEVGKVAEQRVLGTPSVVLMDLPSLPRGDSTKLVTHLAVNASPWGRNYGALVSPTQEGFVRRAVINRRSIIGRLKTPLHSGAAGRWDNANAIDVLLSSGTFRSAENLLVLNGTNLIAVEAANGSHELIQFRKAELMGDGSWRLSELLRGQLGTEEEANFGALADSRLIVLDDSVVPLELDFAERGISLNWRVGPLEAPISSAAYSQQEHTNNGRSTRMLSPVHLISEKVDEADWNFSWIRRGRHDADSWENAEIPLDAQSERYRVLILSSSGQVMGESETVESTFHYDLQNQISDFGEVPTNFEIRVSQISDNGLAGAEASSIVNTI